MRALACLILLLVPVAAQAEMVIAARTIRAQEVIAPGDLTLGRGERPGTFRDPARLVGLEARVALYAGRPVRRGDVGPPALIERNAVVAMIYHRAGLRITADGRALDRAAAGERVRVMNLNSRTTVTGRVEPDGTIRVID